MRIMRLMFLFLFLVAISEAKISSLGTNIVDFSSELTDYIPQNSRTEKFTSFNNLSGAIEKESSFGNSVDRYAENNIFHGLSDMVGNDAKYSNRLNFTAKTSINNYKEPY